MQQKANCLTVQCFLRAADAQLYASGRQAARAPTRRQQSRIPGGKMRKSRLSGLLTISGKAIIWLCLTSSAVAQFRTSIQGVVTDPTGAVIPGATLTLKNLSTNEIFTRTSGGDGVYNFNALPADPFVLTVDHADDGSCFSRYTGQCKRYLAAG